LYIVLYFACLYHVLVIEDGCTITTILQSQYNIASVKARNGFRLNSSV